MLHRKTVWTLTSLAVLLSLVLSACAPGATPTPEPQATDAPEATAAPDATEAPEPTEAAPEATTAPSTDFSGTATITFVQEPDNLNPWYTQMWFSSITTQFWLKGLWSFDDENNPVPELAAEIPSAENGGLSEDGLTVTVKLREGVTWSDGTPVTADDFVFTYDMIMADGNVVQSRYPYEDYVSSVEAPDPQTVVINFSEPFAPWLTNLFPNVLPKHVLQPVFDADGTIDNAEWNRAPTVGVGPFVFNTWESGSHIIFTANPLWVNPPKLEQVVVRIVPDDAAQDAAILAGDSDIGVFLSSDKIETLEADGTVDVVAVGSGYNEGWFLNVNPETARPFMLDANVRRALALATDRFTFVNDRLDPEINPVNTTFWDTTPPFDNPDLEPYPYDPDEAVRLLDEAGWVDSNGDGTRDKDGEELIVRYITNERELRKDMQAVVQQGWSELGIGSELVNYSADIYWNAYNADGPQAQGNYDIAQYSSVGAFPDPEASSNWLCSEISSADNPEGANWQGYCDEEMDALLKEQAVTLDLDARIALYRQISAKMHDEVLYVGIWKDPDLWSINNRLQDVRLSGATPFWNVHEWSVGS